MNLMDAKKSQSSVERKSSLTNAINFVGDVKQEIQRISWTSKDELRTYTKIVVGATFALGMGIYLIDLFIRSALEGLGSIIHWIAG